MFAATTFQTLIDIGFVSLVTLACFYTLTNRSGADKKADIWKRELKEVEQILRALISEATVASRSLDRHLSRRQEELTTLVHKLETLRGSAEQPNSSAVQELTLNNAVDDFDMDDVPNSTWLPRHTTSTASISESDSSNAPTKKKRAAPGNVPPRTLRDEIEVSKTAPMEEEEELDIVAQQIANGIIGDTRLTNPDPIAYKIALRLLRAGKEIHVVARKLSLPLQEIRLLDRLIRATEEETAIKAEDSITELNENSATTSRSSADILVEREITLI